jgi:hypothetical protein
MKIEYINDFLIGLKINYLKKIVETNEMISGNSDTIDLNLIIPF